MRQRQWLRVLPGRFIRASLPRPSTSCMGATAVSATEAITARMNAQWMSRPSVFR